MLSSLIMCISKTLYTKIILCTLYIGFLEAAVSEIAAIQKKSENELEAKFKEHLQLLVDGQNLFMDNCHRLQSNERQIENDMVLILERILDHIDNKWVKRLDLFMIIYYCILWYIWNMGVPILTFLTSKMIKEYSLLQNQWDIANANESIIIFVT